MTIKRMQQKANKQEIKKGKLEQIFDNYPTFEHRAKYVLIWASKRKYFLLKVL